MPPSLRVLHAIHDYLPRHQAGSELYVGQLCGAQRRQGLRPTVLAAEFDPTRAHGQLAWRWHDGVPVAEVVNAWHFASFEGSYADPALEATLAHVLDIVEPHVVHVHNLLNLCLALPSLAHARGIGVAATLHDYTLVCPSGGQRVHREESHVCHVIDPVRCARCFPSSPFAAQLRYGQIARHAPARTLGRLASAVRRLAPLVTTTAASALAHAPGTVVDRAAIDRRLSAARAAFMTFDVVVAPSASMAREYATLGFPTERMIVSDYGLAPIGRLPREHRDDQRLRVGFIGTLVWHKGADLLVEAARHLPVDRVEVLICGDPSVFPQYSASLARQAQGLPVQFMGRFDHDGVGAILAQLDVLVVPSRWLENSPLVIHEAFVAGVPVVGAAIGGIVELLGAGRHGILVPPDDAEALASTLHSLIDAPARLDALARAAPPVKTIDEDARQWSKRYATLLQAAGVGTADAS